MSFLNFSHCPHYHSEASHRGLYHKAITEGTLKEGYACDDLSGLLFVNGQLKKSVSQNTGSNNYFISLEDGKIEEGLLQAEMIK